MDKRKYQRDTAILIFKEFQLGKPIFESYKNLCQKIGPHFMNYPEFEFWFMRFSAGNFDLDYDRSRDPKCRTITDMPVHIFEKICGNLKDDCRNKYWFTLRHVCKSFRDIVDSWTPPKFNEIAIFLSRGAIIMMFDQFEISYIQNFGNLSEIGYEHHPRSLQFGNYRDFAIDDLTKILADPDGCKLESLWINGEIDRVFAQKLFEKSENLGTKIHVDTIEIHPNNIDPVAVNNILNAFPSIKTIDIKSEDVPDEEFTDKIKAITSLKNAEMVTIRNTRQDDIFWDPTRFMIPRMTVKLGRSRVKDCLRLLEALLESPHLEYCHVIGYVRQSVALQKGLKKCGVEVHPRNPEIYSWSIPNSDEIFEIRFIRENRYRPVKTIAFAEIHIERKSKFA